MPWSWHFSILNGSRDLWQPPPAPGWQHCPMTWAGGTNCSLHSAQAGAMFVLKLKVTPGSELESFEETEHGKCAASGLLFGRSSVPQCLQVLPWCAHEI